MLRQQSYFAYVWGPTVKLSGQVQTLITSNMLCCTVEVFSTQGCRHHVDHLVVAAVPQLHLIPIHFTFHLFPTASASGLEHIAQCDRKSLMSAPMLNRASKSQQNMSVIRQEKACYHDKKVQEFGALHSPDSSITIDCCITQYSTCHPLVTALW